MQKAETPKPWVGAEVSVAYQGRRRRGWIAEKTSALIVRLYPENGNGDFEIDNPRQLKVLKRQTIPQGWNAVDMTKEDGTPWISLRFDDLFWEGLHKQSESNGKTPEQQMMDYILSGIKKDGSEPE